MNIFAEIKIKAQFWRLVLITFFCLMGLAAFEIGRSLSGLGVVFSIRTFWWPIVIIASVIAIFGVLFAWSQKALVFTAWFQDFHQAYWPENTGLLLVLFLVLAFGFPTWVIYRGYLLFNGYFVRIFIYMVVSFLGMTLLKPLTPGGKWKIALATSMLGIAAIFEAMAFTPAVSASPFSLGWSEGSRFYYGSLLFSSKLYNQSLPLSPWHPSRYLLLSLPFMISGTPIWFHRLWQVLLWIFLPGWAGYLLANRLKIQNRMLLVAFSAWAFLFLQLGPVYYHMMICLILIFWGVDFNKPVKTLVILLIASVWAGLSRVNWIPVPMFLVLTLYFFERSWIQSKLGWKYLLQPIIWGSGALAALISYFGYIQLSGNAVNKFGSSFTSDLLWNRLWPNSTYWMGILPGALVVSLPLFLIIGYRFRKLIRKWHPLKTTSLAAMVLILLLGGLVVSVKIGGGSNLHNIDAYLALLMIVAVYVFWGKVALDKDESPSEGMDKIPVLVVALNIIIPVLITLRIGGVYIHPDSLKDKRDLNDLQQIISGVQPDEDVLFISERQLVVFDQIPGLYLVPDYEKLELMEMAMAGNEVYLDQFYEDISSHRFALIVSDAVNVRLRDEDHPFSEEHNVWVEKVLVPLLSYYRYSPLGDRRDIVIMTPR